MSKASSGSMPGVTTSAQSGAKAPDSTLPAFTARMLGLRKGWLSRRRDARALGGLNDFMLKDIGLTRADILASVHERTSRRGEHVLGLIFPQFPHNGDQK